MPIANTDIKFRYSVTTGSAGDTVAVTAANSASGTTRGKYIADSTSEVSATALNNVFDDITGDQNAASQVDYRCIFVLNNHGTLPLQNAVLWIVSEVSGGASVALGADTTASSAKGAAPAQALTIANVTTAPSGVSFSSPTTKATGISLGTIAAGSVKAFWIRRTAANTVAVDNDGFTWRVEGDTAA